MAQQDRFSNSRERGREDRRRTGEQDRQQGREPDRDYHEQWGRHQPRQGGAFEDRYSGRGGNESRGDEASQRGEWREQSFGRGRYEDEDYLRVGGSYGGQYGSRDWNDDGQDQGHGYGSQSHPSGISGRYGSDYSMTGTELPGQWERGFSDRSRGTPGGRAGQGYGSSWSGGVDQPQRQTFRGRGPKGYERSDERLKEIICERLMDDPNIDAGEITVEVRNREVTLDGIVEDRRVKYEVEELIERCGGVKDVKNQLRVRARGSESGDDRSSTQATPSESNYGTSGRSGITGSTASSGSSTTSGHSR
ncbi:MAG: BON domain-containing protein [Steroidobacteraceae bacterium]